MSARQPRPRPARLPLAADPLPYPDLDPKMSAMVETFDTQMTDYSANDDVLMQTHSDPWTQEDGAMDDDSFNSFNQVPVLLCCDFLSRY